MKYTLVIIDWQDDFGHPDGSLYVDGARTTEDKIVEFIRDYFSKNNLGGVVIGISGGKDSTVTAALCVQALGKNNVLGVLMPNDDIEKYEELIDLKRQIDFQIEEIKNNSDEKTREKSRKCILV